MTTAPKVRDIQKWVDALRSGEFERTTGALQDEKGYCCLGVACEIFIPKKKQTRCKYEGFLDGGMPEAQRFAPKWLKDVSDDLNQRLVRFGYSDYHTILPLMNDAGKDFDYIADILQAVYIEKVLD